MTSSVFCPKCGCRVLFDLEFEEVAMISSDAAADGTEHVLYGDGRDPEIVWRIGYKSEHTCPCCGAELEISHVLAPHFTAEFAR